MTTCITCAFNFCPGVQPSHQPNMAFWQLTADLPFTLELTFLGGYSDAGEQPVAITAHSIAISSHSQSPFIIGKQMSTSFMTCHCRFPALMFNIWCHAGSEPTEGDQGLLPRAKRWLRGLLPAQPAALPATAGSGSDPAAERVAALTGALVTTAQAF